MLPRTTSPEALAILRIVVFGAWLWHLLSFNVGLYAMLPREFFECAGILCILPQGVWDIVLTTTGLTVFKVTAVVLVMLALLGVRPFPLVAIPAALSVLMFDGIAKSYAGFVNHAQFGILYSALLLALFPAADGLSIMGRRHASPRGASIYAQPMIAVALVLAFAYAFVGVNRILTGGTNVFLGDAFRHWIMLRSVEQVRLGPNVGMVVVETPLLLYGAMIGFFVTTVFEILSPLAVLYRRFRLLWLAVIAPFHLVTLLTMNILFWQNLLLIVVLFTPLAHAATPAARRRDGEGPIVFLDGECVLCHGFAQRLMRLDRQGILRLGILQGETARSLGLAPGDNNASAWSVVLWLPGEQRALRHSDAALGALIALGGAWRLLRPLTWTPRPIRDGLYRLVARNRYRWFGKRDNCSLPTTEQRERLVE